MHLPSRSVVVRLLVASLGIGCTNAFAGAVPEIFLPGELSGPSSEDCLSLSPDGKFAIYDIAGGKNVFMVTSHRVGKGWSKPEIAPFSGRWKDHDPALSPDGSFIVFASNRPAVAGGAPENNWGTLWRVDRKGDGWGEPVRLPESVNASSRTYAPSIAADGSLYFIRPNAAGIMHIFKSRYRDGKYEPAVEQIVGNPAAHEKDPGIAPDESFVVFDSNDPTTKDAPDRLFIAFRDGDHWGEAIDLGDAVNKDNNPWGAHITPDGRTLLYTSDRTVPVAYPRSAGQAKADLERLMAWDSGESNIWKLSLSEWIDAHRGHRR